MLNFTLYNYVRSKIIATISKVPSDMPSHGSSSVKSNSSKISPKFGRRSLTQLPRRSASTTSLSPSLDHRRRDTSLQKSPSGVSLRPLSSGGTTHRSFSKPLPFTPPPGIKVKTKWEALSSLDTRGSGSKTKYLKPGIKVSPSKIFQSFFVKKPPLSPAVKSVEPTAGNDDTLHRSFGAWSATKGDAHVLY